MGYKGLIALLGIFTLFFSCRQPKEKTLIGISFETLQTEYWVASIDALKASCEENELDYLEAVANSDANRQFEQVNNFISRGVDGIVIAPKDAHTVIPIIKAANRAGIPIVVYNRLPALNKGTYTTIVADNYEITKKTVRYMGDLARTSGKKYKAMILIGDLGDTNAVMRRKGFNDAIREYSDVIELVAEVPTEWNQEKALAGVTNALQANPDIGFIFSSSDFLFPSVISALKNADKYYPIGHEKHIILGGFDGDAMAYKMLKSGHLDVTGVQNVYYECDLALRAIMGILEDKPLDRILIDPGFIIHQQNLEQMSTYMWGAGLNSTE
ncbi:sugar ABC transporter substrate-binding protein [Poritiphilus flavus]|uniref:Substrate-binding domain-containing protein n=1 Tax=Poritiphilus flavus TaxID=2697053 RepID=A0A6L9E7T7_9FLAO|nr:sugar ABC transporter substrate-binding protein [Poritiphilus flavus]NAS10623.1 substrate-binding domain-containing protein [Poritiphilus flavus]